jgi:hypothetical protein
VPDLPSVIAAIAGLLSLGLLHDLKRGQERNREMFEQLGQRVSRIEGWLGMPKHNKPPAVE